MTHQQYCNEFSGAMELLIENGFEGMAEVIKILLNEAMKIEREQALSAAPYQLKSKQAIHTSDNGCGTVGTGRARRIDTQRHQKRARQGR
ncbi:MAG: hypothetical protein AB7F23_09620 [Phycisphaerae bacterium]|jgi:hypothetical protein